MLTFYNKNIRIVDIILYPVAAQYTHIARRGKRSVFLPILLKVFFIQER
jgi:hypothetical protein